MLPILQIGPLAIQLPGLLLLVGVWLATLLVDREAPRFDLRADRLNNMVFISLIAGILGARLGYALRFIDIYLKEPLSLFSLNPSTLAQTEGLVVGLIVALIYGQRQKLPLWRSLDALVPSLALFTIFRGLSHLSSGDAFGAPSSVPWSIELWGSSRHPSQLYEILAGIVIFLAVQGLKRTMPFGGFLFFTWVIMLSASTLFLEAFRGDSVIILGSIRSAQVLNLLILLASFIGLHLLVRSSPIQKQ
jgi:prolipoprotein diacylglyceryl transferase